MGSERTMQQVNAQPLRLSPSAMPGHAEHVPVLDGIRGLAILLVMFAHFTVLNSANALDRAWLSVAEYGWIGVDLFFVLSGFLITGILFDARGGEGYFRNFYARRVLRIFPLYYAVLAVSLIVLPLALPRLAATFGTVGDDAPWYWLYLQNFPMGFGSGYTHGILAVTWSLAIEEQFYLIWPAVVILFGRRALMGIALAIIVAALATRIGILLLADAPGIALYVLTPCRMDGLAIGALIALAARGERGLYPLRPVAAVILGVGLVGLVFTFITAWVLNEALLFSFLGLIFGALLLLTLTAPAGGWLAGVFNAPWIRTLGKYSYALYLFQLPLRSLLRDRVFGPASFPTFAGSQLPGQFIFYALATALTLGAALASWHLFEKRFLKLKRFFPSRRSASMPPAP